MSRTVPSAILTALAQPEVEPFYAIEIDLDSGPLRLWTGYGDRTIDGETYTGGGTLMGIEGLEEVADLSAKAVTLTLSGMPASVVSLALQEPYQRRKVRILWGVETGSAPLPAELVQIASVPAQDNSTWTLRSYDASSYVGRDVRLVIRYQSGSSFTGDAQFDDFTIGGTTYNPENGTEGFQRNSDVGSSVSSYASVSWQSLATGVVNGLFNRDSGGTGSTGTANTSGNTGSFYYYAETSGDGLPDKYFWLRSPQVTLSSGTVSFYSAQNGATCGPITAYLDVAASAGGGSSFDVVEVFSGSLNQMVIEDGPESGTLSVTVDSKLVELEKSSNRRYTSESHKSRHPNDTFFDYVAKIQDAEIVFGR